MSKISRQFEAAERVEEIQRRRFSRRRESGFVGNGYWYANYPNMVGTLGSGSLLATPPRAVARVAGYQTRGTAVANGGGTAAYITGASGGGMP